MKQLIFIKLSLFLITSCSYNTNLDSYFHCKKLNLNCLKNNQRIVFKTSKGDFDVQLYGENSPVTVSNFIENIQKNIYKNKKFYKIINFPQVKVIHSGILSNNNYEKEENLNLKKVRKDIPLEIKLKKDSEPTYSYQFTEPSEIINIVNSFERGSIAMVKRGVRNSSSTEFFFVTSKFPELNGRYSVFGKIVEGIEILEKIEKKDILYEIIISN